MSTSASITLTVHCDPSLHHKATIHLQISLRDGLLLIQEIPISMEALLQRLVMEMASTQTTENETSASTAPSLMQWVDQETTVMALCWQSNRELVTENNWSRLKQDPVVLLCFHPTFDGKRIANIFVTEVEQFSTSTSLRFMVFQLQSSVKIIAFAEAFNAAGGTRSLLQLIHSVASGNILAYSLATLQGLIETCPGLITAQCTPVLVEKLLLCAWDRSLNVAKAAMVILTRLVQSNCIQLTASGHMQHIEADVRQDVETIEHPSFFERILQRLQGASDYQTQFSCVQLLNAVYSCALQGTSTWHVSFCDQWDKFSHRQSMIALLPSPSDAMTRPWQDLCHLFGRGCHKRLTSQSVVLERGRVQSLFQQLFPLLDASQQWLSLGFTHATRPWLDLKRVGLLGLMHFVYFMEQAQSQRRYLPPLAQHSFRLTELLATQWQVDTSLSTNPPPLLILAWERIHCSALTALCRLGSHRQSLLFPKNGLPSTATLNLDNLCSLLCLHVRHVLTETEALPVPIEQQLIHFEQQMLHCTYATLCERHVAQVDRREEDLLARPCVRELQASLQQEALALLQKQRLSCLMRGSWFTVMTGASSSHGNTAGNTSSIIMTPNNTGFRRGPQKVNNVQRRFCRLAPHARTLLYADFSATHQTFTMLDYEALTETLDVSLIADIVTNETTAVVQQQQQKPLEDDAASVVDVAQRSKPLPVPHPTTSALNPFNITLTAGDGSVLLVLPCDDADHFATWLDGLRALVQIQRPQALQQQQATRLHSGTLMLVDQWKTTALQHRLLLLRDALKETTSMDHVPLAAVPDQPPLLPPLPANVRFMKR